MNASFTTPHDPPLRSPLAWLLQLTGLAPRVPAAPVHRVHVLDRGETMEIAEPLRHELVCLRGTLWITHDQLPADHIVERGQSYLACSAARMLVHALGDARVAVSTRRG